LKIRKYGTDGPFREYDDEACAWCEAGSHTNWGEGGTIFFENDAGELRKVEGWPALIGVAMLCRPVTRDEIERELAAGESPGNASAGGDEPNG